MKKTMQVLGQLLLCSSLIFLCENVQSQLDISVSSTPVLCNGDLSEVTISVSGGTAPYSGIGTVSSSDVALIITGVIDGPLSGGVPKAVELYAVSDIGDLSEYGLGSANNGGGTDGQEFTFPSVSVNQGEYIYVSSNSSGVAGFTNFFGFAPDYNTFALSINGDDAVELFKNGIAVDVFGNINVDGSGQAWEYLDGWAYRNNGVAPTTAFNASNWSYSGPNALDGSSSNSSTSSPFPLATFQTGQTGTQFLPQGDNHVIISDANGLSESIIVSIGGPDALSLDASFADILCFGETTDVVVSATGGVPPYQGAFSPLQSSLIITGAIDGPLSGGVPKAVEIYVIEDVADLSIYGLGSANNGGGTDGQEFTFPSGSANAGDYIYVSSSSSGVAGFTNFFGFAPNYSSFALGINGDDAVELFKNGSVVDVFGDINVDGSGQAWDYLDGWAYRNTGSLPNGGNFVVGDWSFSGTNALDGSSSNSTTSSPMPIGTFTTSPTEGVYANLGAGSYDFLVVDANGCSETISVLIDQPDALVVDAGSDAIVYYGYGPESCTTLSASASGGTGSYIFDWSNGTFSSDNIVCPQSSEVYSVSVTDANGCTASDDVNVCSVDVQCRAGNSNNIKVEMCHNGNTICINANAVQAHLNIGDVLGACGEVDAVCGDDYNTAMTLFPVELRFNVYPNPSSGTFKLEVENVQLDVQVSFKVVNVLGQLVYSGTTRGFSEITLGDVNPGNYLVFVDGAEAPEMITIK